MTCLKTRLAPIIPVAIPALVLGIAIGSIGTGALQAQQSGIKRTPLQKVTLSDVPGKEAVMGIAEVAPGVAAGRHSHPGYEMGYALEGSSTLEIEGEAPIVLSAGTAYAIPAGKVHDVKNTGSVPAKVLAIYIVDQGKPLAAPAP